MLLRIPRSLALRSLAGDAEAISELARRVGDE